MEIDVKFIKVMNIAEQYKIALIEIYKKYIKNTDTQFDESKILGQMFGIANISHAGVSEDNYKILESIIKCRSIIYYPTGSNNNDNKLKFTEIISKQLETDLKNIKKERDYYFIQNVIEYETDLFKFNSNTDSNTDPKEEKTITSVFKKDPNLIAKKEKFKTLFESILNNNVITAENVSECFEKSEAHVSGELTRIEGKIRSEFDNLTDEIKNSFSYIMDIMKNTT